MCMWLGAHESSRGPGQGVPDPGPGGCGSVTPILLCMASVSATTLQLLRDTRTKAAFLGWRPGRTLRTGREEASPSALGGLRRAQKALACQAQSGLSISLLQTRPQHAGLPAISQACQREAIKG